ncbi:MAG: hypothetical protein IPH84_05990 [Bacteroidales bacterium]|nr:hypothetical protein [Bacteroidales bacterium]
MLELQSAISKEKIQSTRICAKPFADALMGFEGKAFKMEGRTESYVSKEESYSSHRENGS